MFLTVAVLRINWAGVICARVVWSRFLEAVSTSAEREISWTIELPSQLDMATVCAVLSEFSLHYALDRMLACHADDGKPRLHKSPAGSSGKCPSIHEVWT